MTHDARQIEDALRASLGRIPSDSSPRVFDVHKAAGRARRRRSVALVAGITIGVAVLAPLYALGGFRIHHPSVPVGGGEVTPSSFAATFSLADGWYQFSTGPVAREQGAARTWVVTRAGFALEDRRDMEADSTSTTHDIASSRTFGRSTLSGLGQSDVLIVASSTPNDWGAPTPPAGLDPMMDYPARDLPLNLSVAASTTDPLHDGSSHLLEYFLGASVDGQSLDVRVFFGTQAPTVDVEDAARSELGQLVMPDYVDGAAPAPPTFARDGWFQVSTSPVNIDDSAAPQSWFSSVAFDPEDLALNEREGFLWTNGIPRRTIASLEPDGIVLVATATVTGGSVAVQGPNVPSIPVDISLTKAEVQHDWEGQVSEEVPEYVVWSGTQDPWIELRVFFGSQEPSDQMLDEAQSAIDSILVPKYSLAAG